MVICCFATPCTLPSSHKLSLLSLQTSRSGMVSEEAAQEAARLSGVKPDAGHVPGSNVGTGNISGS